MPKRAFTETDIHIGRRIYTLRNALKLSQVALAKAVGVTFQQIQKYEKGTNRVSGHRLQAMAAALHVPIAYFFDGAPGGECIPSSAAPNFIDEFLADRRGIELARRFVKMNHTERAAVLALADTLAKKPSTAKTSRKSELKRAADRYES